MDQYILNKYNHENFRKIRKICIIKKKKKMGGGKRNLISSSLCNEKTVLLIIINVDECHRSVDPRCILQNISQ